MVDMKTFVWGPAVKQRENNWRGPCLSTGPSCVQARKTQKPTINCCCCCYLGSIVSHTADRLIGRLALFEQHYLPLLSVLPVHFLSIFCARIQVSAESKQLISCLHCTQGHLTYCALCKRIPIFCVVFPILSLVNRNITLTDCFAFHFHASSWNFASP